jgi:hypothetical protein
MFSSGAGAGTILFQSILQRSEETRKTTVWPNYTFRGSDFVILRRLKPSAHYNGAELGVTKSVFRVANHCAYTTQITWPNITVATIMRPHNNEPSLDEAT